MSDNHYDMLETIVSIPVDMTPLQQEDLIVNTISTIKNIS